MRYIITVLCLSFYTHVYCFDSIKNNQESQSLITLIDSKQIEVEIEGYYGKSDFTPIDNSGFYYGQCVTMTFINKSDSVLKFNVPTGSILKCKDTLVQDMIITKSFFFTLNSKARCLVYAMCGEINDAGPTMKIFYNYGGMAERNVVNIAKIIDDKNLQNQLGQFMMWAVRNNADSTKLIEYGATNHELKLICEYINEVGIKTKLTDQFIKIQPKNQLDESKEEISNNSLGNNANDSFALNKLSLIIIGFSGFILFSLILIIFRLNKKIKDSNNLS